MVKRCVWSFRDRSARKDWRCPFTLSKDGPEDSKRIVGRTSGAEGDAFPVVDEEEDANLLSGRIVASETEAPNMSANLVRSGRAVVQSDNAAEPSPAAHPDHVGPHHHRHDVHGLEGSGARLSLDQRAPSSGVIG